MEKKNAGDNNDQVSPGTKKKDVNAGSGGFNQGAEQDPGYNDAKKVSDEEKKTGHLPFPSPEEKDQQS